MIHCPQEKSKCFLLTDKIGLFVNGLENLASISDESEAK
jgi:hypothetical protein